MNQYDYESRDALIADLREFAEDCLERIDGGEECRGNDARLSAMADAMNRAADLIAAQYAAYNAKVNT